MVRTAETPSRPLSSPRAPSTAICAVPVRKNAVAIERMKASLERRSP